MDPGKDTHLGRREGGRKRRGQGERVVEGEGMRERQEEREGERLGE